ncbi:hypothetical protein RB195_010704 [Necator americanus]|uniref:Tetratricopeptide repeat protein n=1 Tax=Necator americanus TaxID=51031 RepID=A0ABR1CZ73_NECAM
MSLAEESLKIARLLGILNQTEEALEQYDVVEGFVALTDDVTQKRFATQIRIGRGIVYGLMGETEKCLEELSDLNTTNEDDAIAIANAIAACHVKEGNIQNAIEYLNALLKSSSDGKQQKLFGHTCFLLAREQIRNGRCASAVRLAKRILRLAKTTSDGGLERAGLQLLAAIYEEEQDARSASVLLRKYLEVPGASVHESVNALLQLAALAPKTGEDPVAYLGDALELARTSCNLDTIVLAQSAMLRHVINSVESDDFQFSQLLSSQKELLKAEIGAASRSIIFEDLATCEKGESSGSRELSALEESLTEAQEGNHILRELMLIEKLGDSLMLSGRLVEAEGFYQQLLALARQLRAVAQIKRGYMKLAILASESSQWTWCSELTRNALTLSRLCHDYASKAYMLLLSGRAEMSRGNSSVALNIFVKAISVCEQHELHATMVLASRFAVDAAIKSGLADYQVLEHIHRHVSFFEYEVDQKEKLRSLIRLVRFDQDLDHLTALSAVNAAREGASGLAGNDKATILIECVDACQTLGMRDEAWRLLEDFMKGCSLSEVQLQEVAERLTCFPLHRRVLPLLRLVEQGFSDPRFLAQLAAFTPTFVLARLPDKELLPRLVCYVKMEDWKNSLECATIAMRDDFTARTSKRYFDEIFAQLSTEETIQQVLLVSRWYVDGAIDWNTLSQLDEAAFCSFFDLNFAELLRDRVTLVPRSRAHLHALMSLGHYDVMHQSAHPVEKIICAANTGETEMIEMWYDKHRHLETSKWLLDKRLTERHGGSMHPFHLQFPSTPFKYDFTVGRVELTWSWPADSGRPEGIKQSQIFLALSLPGEISTSSISCYVTFKTTFSCCLRDVAPLIERHQRTGLMMLSNKSKNSDRDTFSLCDHLTRLRSSSVAVVDVSDNLLHQDICFSIGKTPSVMITRGTLPHEVIRSLFVCGTSVVVELIDSAQYEEIEHLIAEICEADDIAKVLSSYSSFMRSADCLRDVFEASTAISSGLDSFSLHWRNDRSDATNKVNHFSKSRREECKDVPGFVRETQHIDNLWLNAARLRKVELSRNDAVLSETNELLQRMLCKDSTFSMKQRLNSRRDKHETSKKKRRKKARGTVMRDYLSDSGETGEHKFMQPRAFGDLPPRPISSVTCYSGD